MTQVCGAGAVTLADQHDQQLLRLSLLIAQFRPVAAVLSMTILLPDHGQVLLCSRRPHPYHARVKLQLQHRRRLKYRDLGLAVSQRRTSVECRMPPCSPASCMSAPAQQSKLAMAAVLCCV